MITWQDGLYDGANESDVNELPEALNIAQAVNFNDGLHCSNGDAVEQGHQDKQDPDNDEASLALPGPMPAKQRS